MSTYHIYYKKKKKLNLFFNKNIFIYFKNN